MFVRLLVMFGATACVASLLVSCGGEESPEALRDVDQFVESAEEYVQRGQFRAAVIEARNAIQADPDDMRGHLALARIMLEAGQPRQAIEVLESVDSSDPDFLLTLARAYTRSGKTRSASDVLENHREEVEKRPVALRRLEAELAMAHRDYDKAESFYQRVLEKAPDDVDAKLGLARILALKGQTEAAEAAVDRIMAESPENPMVMALGASLRAERGDLEGAEDLMMQAIALIPSSDFLTPERYTILTGLRDILTRQGKTGEALIYSELLAESMGDAQVINERLDEATTAMSDSDFERARAKLNEVLELVPNSELAGTMLGVLEYLQGNDEAAARQFETYLDPEVAAPATLQMYATAELRINRPEKVIEALEADIDRVRDGRVVALYAIALMSAGRQAEAQEYFERSVELDPDNGRLRLPLARFYDRQGDPERALTMLEQAFELQPRDDLIQRSLLQQLLQLGKNEAARKFIEELRSRYEDSTPTQLLVANYLAAQREFDEAKAVVKRIVDRDPSLAAYHLSARLELAQENLTDAAGEYRQMISKYPEDRDSYKGLITTFELRGDVQAGLTEVETLARDNGADAPLLVLSEYFGRNGDFDKAFEWLARVGNQDSIEARRLERALLISKGRSDLREQDFEDARQTLLTGLTELPEDQEFLALLSRVEIESGSYKEARRILDQLEQTNPNPAVAGVLNGDIAAAEGRFDDALEEYDKAWDARPSNQIAMKRYEVMRNMSEVAEADFEAFFAEWEAANLSGNLLPLVHAGYNLERGELELARKQYEELTQTAPNISIAHNNLAWIYGEDEPEKALAAAQRAAELAPNSGEILDTYGWFLYKNGRIEDARVQLARAAELAPNNEEIRQHLAEVNAN